MLSTHVKKCHPNPCSLCPSLPPSHPRSSCSPKQIITLNCVFIVAFLPMSLNIYMFLKCCLAFYGFELYVNRIILHVLFHSLVFNLSKCVGLFFLFFVDPFLQGLWWWWSLYLGSSSWCPTTVSCSVSLLEFRVKCRNKTLDALLKWMFMEIFSLHTHTHTETSN